MWGPKTRHNFIFLPRNKIHKNKSHASFLYETSYFGLMRQHYLVSLWQLDLERAETAEVPAGRRKTF